MSASAQPRAPSRAVRRLIKPGPAPADLPPGRSAIVTTAVVAAACVLTAITFRIFDTDFWQHLAVGRAIWERHMVPARQIWCWPTLGEASVLPSWAFRAILWPFWQLGELPGLYVWRWLTTIAAFGLLWLAARRMGARGLTPLPLLVMAAMIYRQRSLIRPETAVAVLLAALILVLEIRRSGGRSGTLWLIGIAWLWANIHISYYQGLVILGVYALEEGWRLRRTARGNRTGRRGRRVAAPDASTLTSSSGRRSLWVALVACAAISFVNPFGFRALAQPFEYLLAGRHEPIYRTIAELQPVVWAANDRNGLVLLMILWPAFLVLRALRRELDPVETALFLIFTPPALMSQRFTGTWALIAAPFLARDLGQWIAARRWPAWTAPSLSRAGIASTTCLLLTGVELSRADFQPGVGVIETTTPSAACDFVDRHGVRGRVFNHFELGGYLLWRFWPDPTRLPFMDIHQTGTRRDRQDYVAALVNPNAWRALDDRYRFDWVLLRRGHSPGERLLDFLDADTTFIPVFLDDAAALYLRRTGALAAVADSFGLRVARGGEAWLEPLDARVAVEPELGERLEAELRRLASASTASSMAHNHLANLMLMRGHLGEARDHLDEAHASNPALADYHYRRGLIASAEGRLREALREYDAERRLAETSWLDVRIASLHQRLGDPEAARRWYRRALRLDPGNDAARDSLRGLQAEAP